MRLLSYSLQALFKTVLLLLCTVLQAQDTEHLRLSNLPHVYINTFTGSGIYSKTNYVYARMWYVDEQNQVSFYDSLEIRGRGNSTWNLAKKPYRIKFHQKEKLLGQGRAKTKKWTLLANHGDKTLIRNAVTSLMGERAGLKFNPAAKFVDLTLNGAYIGNYQISDAVDVRPHRVNIAEQDLPLNDTSNITGGYLLEADGFKDFRNGQSGFYSARQGVPIRIHYPDEDDIDHSQYSYIRQYILAFEEHLYADDFADPSTGYRPFVDSESLANWYICTELSGNIDGFFSTYFYKDAGDKRLYWGPLWDYDIAYNNDTRGNPTTQKLICDINTGVCRQWFLRMWHDPWFCQLINRRYKELREAGIEQHLLNAVDSLGALNAQSAKLNHDKYGINKKVYNEVVLHDTYAEYLADLKAFITAHLAFLDTEFPYRTTQVDDMAQEFILSNNNYYRIQSVGANTLFDVTDEKLTEGSLAPVSCLEDGSCERQEQCVTIEVYRRIDEAIDQVVDGITLQDLMEMQHKKWETAPPENR